MLAHPQQRRGQAAFNLLYELAPELAEEARTAECDPFYAQTGEERFRAFESYIAQHVAAIPAPLSRG